MLDFNHPLRKSWYELLNGQLTYDGSPVPVFDEKVKKGQDNQHYVIVGNISSSSNDKFPGWSRKLSVILDIVTKTTDAVTKNIADDIAGQIFALAMPSITIMGLTAPSGFNYVNLFLDSDRYLDLQIGTSAIVRRILTFSITANQT